MDHFVSLYKGHLVHFVSPACIETQFIERKGKEWPELDVYKSFWDQWREIVQGFNTSKLREPLSKEVQFIRGENENFNMKAETITLEEVKRQRSKAT
ncbi:hypothetical protein Scep_029883 [Stephania cephalantha]|uniref:Uncharacterized protein n=1 Tax=Stephania cephalantha TaxID=152367 RepID=A0AAP0HG15_9MAGN